MTRRSAEYKPVRSVAFTLSRISMACGDFLLVGAYGVGRVLRSRCVCARVRTHVEFTLTLGPASTGLVLPPRSCVCVRASLWGRETSKLTFFVLEADRRHFERLLPSP